MKRSATRFLSIAAMLVSLSATPTQAGDLGIDLSTLLKGLNERAAAAGSAFKVRKIGCRENKKPGDASKKIVSCSHVLGPGKILITNADPAGPLLDVNTQRWEAGSNGPAVNMMSWMAGVLTSTPSENHTASANQAVKKAQANKTSATDVDGFNFVMMDFGNSMVISVSRN